MMEFRNINIDFFNFYFLYLGGLLSCAYYRHGV